MHDTDDHLISRTEQKKAAQALHDLGKSLTQLNKAQLDAIPLEPSLREAIDIAKNIKVGNGRKRQLKFIGKLLRKIDSDAIIDALSTLKQKDNKHVHLLHQAEQWRDKLLINNSADLSEFIKQHAHCERQQLTQLLRTAIKEQQKISASPSANIAPKNTRLLFKMIHSLLEHQNIEE